MKKHNLNLSIKFPLAIIIILYSVASYFFERNFFGNLGNWNRVLGGAILVWYLVIFYKSRREVILTSFFVKDHISAWAYPSLDFYHRVRRLPNVRLLGPNAPTKQLIKASTGIITLTSTVGYEALLLKTRVYLYGRVFYEFHKGVTRVENPAKLRDLLLTGMAQPVDWDDDYNNDFVCAYHQSTLPGILNLMQGPREGALAAERVYDEIIRSGYLGAVGCIC